MSSLPALVKQGYISIRILIFPLASTSSLVILKKLLDVLTWLSLPEELCVIFRHFYSLLACCCLGKVFNLQRLSNRDAATIVVACVVLLQRVFFISRASSVAVFFIFIIVTVTVIDIVFISIPWFQYAVENCLVVFFLILVGGAVLMIIGCRELKWALACCEELIALLFLIRRVLLLILSFIRLAVDIQLKHQVEIIIGMLRFLLLLVTQLRRLYFIVLFQISLHELSPLRDRVEAISDLIVLLLQVNKFVCQLPHEGHVSSRQGVAS